MSHLRRSLVLCAFAALLPLAAGAQTATLVRDLFQVETGTPDFTIIPDAASVPGHVFFPAITGSSDNRELWTSDGTAEGTFVLKDVCPGPCGSDPVILGRVKNTLLWLGRSEDSLFYLWRSDGTRAGTYRLVEEAIQGEHGDPGMTSALAGDLLYTVSGSRQADTLWQTDGTAAGTRKVLSFEAGQRVERLLAGEGKLFFILSRISSTGATARSLGSSDGTAEGTRVLRDLGGNHLLSTAVAGGHLFFALQDFAVGQEIWASDGTEEGTRAVTDFVPLHPFSGSGELPAWVSGGRFLFVADDVVHGQELYESDGTPAGTRRVTDFGTVEPFFAEVVHLGDHIVFTADDGLGHSGVWSTAGDPASTRFLSLPCGSDCWEDRVRAIVKVGPRAVILVTASSGDKILSTDGKPAGARVLFDDCSEVCDVVLPDDLPAEMDTLPFATTYPDTLWVTDGTPAGTRKRATLPNGTIDTSAYLEIPAGSFTLIFAKYRSTTALWALGPGRGGPRLVTAPATNGSWTFLENLAAFQDRLVFTACVGAAYSLWQSRGTEESTVPVVDLYPPVPDSSFCGDSLDDGDVASLGTSLVFLKEKAHLQKELWGSDGTPEGTRRLTPADLTVRGPLAVGTGRVWFQATSGQTPSVWTSDGTPAGTVQLASWPAGSGGPSSLTAVGNELYFFFGTSPSQLWKSDGTPQGTKKVIDNSGFSSSHPASFTRLGSTVYYVARRTTRFGEALWRTDGTAAGTRELGDVAGMYEEPYPNDLIEFQGSLYFFAWSERDVRGLWRSDGTAAGTVLLAEFPEPDRTSSPSGHRPTIAGGKLFFITGDGVHGTELWVTDGTPAGTRLVEDIRPGSVSSLPDDLTAAGGRLFFTAGEETYGRELWMSDGTAAGTRLVQDIAPFGASSEPDRLTVAGDRLYFVANDGLSGRELWSLPLSGPAGCQSSSTRLCLNGGRYQVEASWRTGQLSGHGTAVSLSGDTGYFWFFQSTNVEAVVKVLDGQGINGHVWVFYGALSDVDYTITVTDTQTGVTRRYHNPAGQLASVGDTKGFGPLGAYSAAPTASQTIEAPPSLLPLVTERIDRAAAAPCQASARRLCLNGNRFAVEVAWKDFQGNTGKGTAAPLTSDTGTFWFFNAANVELVVKILDGRPVNNKFWTFYGALSNVEYTMTVTDTQAGTVKTYKNPSGRFASVADTKAF